MDNSIFRSWDPLYGRIDFSDFEYSLLSCPEVQRLRYVRMCNINSLLVTGASEISRFEHTIGVLRLVQEWIKYNSIPASQAKIIRAAALLHDMQTGPFGHSLQYILEDNDVDGQFDHEDLSHGSSKTYFQTTTANAAFSGYPFKSTVFLKELWPLVAATIRGEGKYGPLIAGTIDLDNIDNVIRLGFHAGAAERDDAQLALQLARDISIHEDVVSLSSFSIPNIQKWQEVRRRLYHLLLLDWAEFSAKAMLTLAMELAVKFRVIGSDSWLYSDFQLLEHLESNSVGEGQQISNLVKRIKTGQLYYPILLVSSTTIDSYSEYSVHLKKREFEAYVEEKVLRPSKQSERTENPSENKGQELEGDGGSLLLHFILDKGKTERSLPIFIRDRGRIEEIGVNSSQILIGLFITKKPKSEKVLHDLRECALNKLHELGFEDLEDIEDPMGSRDVSLSDEKVQLPLI